MYPYLVADIGGTNARFALVTGKQDNDFVFEQIHVLPTSDHPTFEAALKAYYELAGNPTPSAACIGIAGPVGEGRVKMTNLNWEFKCDEVASEFNLDRLVAINDFAAVASACGHLQGEHLYTVKAGEADPTAPRAVFGPGTGLGVAGLVNASGRWHPLPGEGGHVNVAPASALEADVIKTAMASNGHVSAEWFISGPGLVNLYRTVCNLQGVAVEPLKPSDITRLGLENSNSQCAETMKLFCSFAGTFAGNLALTYGAKGGVYIAGGIFPRFKEFLAQSQFIERFKNKGVMSHYVENIPVCLINHTETAFVGTAAYLEQLS